MDNSPRLPAFALVLAVALTVVAIIAHRAGGVEAEIFVLSELEIGLVAVAFALTVFGIEGLISVLLEGRRLHPGIVRPRLTDPLSQAIVLFSLALFGIAIWLGYGIVSEWGPLVLGVAAGLGCLVLALLLVFYKEAFIGDEAGFDEREDGVPW
jgi:hypothetical protein